MSYKLSFLSCLGIVIGSVIGSGIFMVPSLMIRTLPSPYMIILVWLLAGIISIIGGWVIAEIGDMHPEAKNLLDYYKQLFPPWVSYAFSLASNWIINPCGTVAIAFVFAEYAGYFMPLNVFEVKIVAIVLLLGVTTIDSINMSFADKFQIILSGTKITAILLLVFFMLIPGEGNINNFNSTKIIENWSMLKIAGAFVAACTGALNAFDGWYMVTHLSAEAKGGNKTVGRAIFVGLSICLLLYMLTTIAYHFVLTPTEVMSAKLVAVTALEKVSFSWAPGIIAAIILISTASAVNANIISASRLIVSSAKNEMLPAYFSKINKRDVPLRALWLIFFFEMILVITGSYELFLDISLFTIWLFVTVLTGGFLGKYVNRDTKRSLTSKLPMIGACILLLIFGFIYLTSFLFNIL